jgi:ribosomal protein L37AE/L43A
MHDRMLCRHDPSYAHYLNVQRERAAAAHHAALRQQQQQQREEELRREAAGREGGPAQLSDSELQLQAYKNDTRAGLTVEDVLRYNAAQSRYYSFIDIRILNFTICARCGSKFVRSEDIEDYSCNHCRKPTSGTLTLELFCSRSR